MNLVYASTALEDLDGISEWIARGDPDRALSFVGELRAAADALIDTGLLYPSLDEQRYPGVRRRNVRNYRILFRVTADEVAILHFHHGRRATPPLETGSSAKHAR